MPTEFRVKRIYDAAADDDGFRLFVDRLWARGVTKAAARIDCWAKELTPSTELRKWYHAHLDSTEEFASRYRAELHSRANEIGKRLQSIDSPVVTLVTATKDLQRGHVAVLREFLNDSIKRSH